MCRDSALSTERSKDATNEVEKSDLRSTWMGWTSIEKNVR